MAGRGFTIEVLPGMLFPWLTRMPIDLWVALRQFVYAHDKGRCQYCDCQVELFECHIHHVLALSEGGVNHPTNLKTLCKDCHRQRHPHMLSIMERLALR